MSNESLAIRERDKIYPKMIYLDYAAATPVDHRVLTAMMPYFQDDFYNPSAAYLAARQVRADVEAARHQLAQVIGAKPAEIILTAGATESINLAIHGVEGQIISTAIEHSSVLAAISAKGGQVIPVDDRGQIDLTALKAAITDDTELISIGYVNSETGMVQNIRRVADIVGEIRQDRQRREIDRPLWLHTDASQAAGLLDLI